MKYIGKVLSNEDRKEVRGLREEEMKEAIALFLMSDYGRGFVEGMQAAIEAISKKIPTPSQESVGE